MAIEVTQPKGESKEYVIEEPHTLDNVKRQVALFL